ncbi:MAG: VIT domain-containing protein [Polyangiales bacterium]
MIASGDAVYLTSMNGVVQRWNARNGLSCGRATSATSAPAVDGERVYVAQRAPGAASGRPPSTRVPGATVSRGALPRAAYTRQRPDTGGTEAGWAWEGSRPAFADGRVYTAMGDAVVARDAATGAEVWRKRNPLGGSVRGVTSPAVVGSQLVVGTRGGDVFGLDIDTGETTWAWRVGEPILFQPAVAEGWVYVATQRGKVVGFEVGDASVDGWHMWGGNAQHAGLSPSTPSAVDAPPRSGVLRSTGRDGAPMPLLHADVSVSVEGPVARVVVEQTFTNPHPRAVDAEYLLPLPESAGVDAMELRVGDRVIRADIQRRDDARRTYASARARGRTAALLEQQRPNLFRQSVANVRPGASVRVRVALAQTVAWREGRYELVMPLNPGSRYTPGQGGATPDRPPGDVTIRARIDLGVALAEVSSPSHAVTVRGEGGAREVTLPAAVTPDRDFVLRYRPVADVAATAALATRGPDGGYLSLQLLPAVDLPDDRLTPRELVFVVDTSSSMRGRPLAQAQAVVREALAHARATDTVRVLRFSDAVSALDARPLPATPENVARARAFVDAMRAAGATEMLPGLRAALAGRADDDRVRVVVLLTDGYIGNEAEVMAAVRPALGTARVFAVGVGGAVNRYLLEGVSEEGRGEAMVVTPSDDPTEAARRFHAMIARPVLTDVEVDWGGLAVSDVYPRVVPDLFADRPLVLQARYARGGRGMVRVRAAPRTGADASGAAARRRRERDRDAVGGPALAVGAGAGLKDLSRALLLGETPAIRDAITEVGLRHHLVTAYTSFVAVDEGEPARASTRVVHRNASVASSSVGYGAQGGGARRRDRRRARRHRRLSRSVAPTRPSLSAVASPAPDPA